jgi:hypothetical protein
VSEKLIGFRFPAPHPEILPLIPDELHPLFSNEQESAEPDEVTDVVDYLYTVHRPDGSSDAVPVYREQCRPEDLPVAFILGSRIELDGIGVEVVDCTRESIEDGWTDERYMYWRVTVRLPERGSDG